MLYFPFFNKDIIQIADKISSVYESLIILATLLAHRAQASASLASLLTKEKILQLASMKWNAKQIANNPKLRLLYALVAISETISFEFKNIKDMGQAESANYLLEQAEKLATEPKPKNSRIIPAGALNEENINLHRHGKMAQYIGLLQSRPIYEPNTILKGVAVSNLQPSQLIPIILETLEKMEIQPISEDSLWTKTIKESPEGNSLPEFNALMALTKAYITTEKVTFDDTIGIGTTKNLLPIEIIMEVSRPIGDPINAPELTEAQQENIFLTVAVKQQQTLAEEKNKKLLSSVKTPRTNKKKAIPKQDKKPYELFKEKL